MSSLHPTTLLPLGLLAGLGWFPATAIAQPITVAPDGTGTLVQVDGTVYQIDGGTQAQDNLFHSFQTFGLNAGETARFNADPSIQNILGRVVGGSPSLIDGVLQVQNSAANLYLMNPGGILFGPNGRLDLAGSFTATTATGIGWDDAWFTLASGGNEAALIGAPNAFQFATESPGGIVNQGVLEVQPGQQIRLVGGSVLNTGTIAAPGGAIAIAAVTGEQIVRIEQDGMLLSLDLPIAGGVNPDPGAISVTGLSIPELLTGEGASGAGQVEVQGDGTIRLVAAPGVAPIVTPVGSLAIAGNLDVSGLAGGLIELQGETITLPFGTVNLIGSGSGGGGHLDVYAQHELTLGVEVLSSPGSEILFDPATFTIGVAEAATLVAAMAGGGTVTVEATDSITVDALIDSSLQATLATLNFQDENADGNLIINFNQPIRLGVNQTLIGEGSLINVGAGGLVQNGIDVAATDAIVNLAAATYRSGQVLSLARSLTLQGQGVGATILSGDADGNGTGDHRVLQAIGAGLNVTLSGLTIADGLATQGAGIFTQGTNLTLMNSALQGNRAIAANGVDSTVPIGTTVISTGADALGGGLFHQNGNLLLSNTTLDNNSAQGGNAGNATTATADFANSIGGSARGGAVYHMGTGTVTIANSTFTNNSAQGGVGGRAEAVLGSNSIGGLAQGGALFIDADGAAVVINNSRFITNQVTGGNGGDALLSAINATSSGGDAEGGAVYLDYRSLAALSTAAIDASLWQSNLALGGDAGTASSPGDAIANGGNARGAGWFSSNRSTIGDSEIRLQTSTWSGNVSEGGAGGTATGGTTAAANGGNAEGSGLYVYNQPVYGGSYAGSRSLTLLDRSTISGNFTTSGFGGTQILAGLTTIGASGVASGGGIFALSPSLTSGDGQLTLTRSTVTANAADQGGGMVSTGDTAIVANTILAGNFAIATPDVSGTFTDQGFNLIGIADGSTDFTTSTLVGTLATPLNPGLSPLALYGGLLPTHRLNATSPALDAGNPAVTTPDQRGMVLNGIADIGAYERGAIATFTTVAGDNQSTVVNQLFPTQINILAQDALGGTLNGIPVSVTPPASGASAVFPLSAVLTGADGLARFGGVRANTVAGSYAVAVSATGVPPLQLTLTNLPDVAALITPIAGNNQTTTVNQAFATDLQLQVTDQYGNVIPNVAVTLTAPNSGTGASFAGGSSLALTTNLNGVATATPLTANLIAGSYAITAASGSLPTVNFNLTNSADVAAILTAIAGNNQSTVVANPVATDLQVQVTDQYGNAVAGVVVTLSAPGAGASGVFTGKPTLAITTDSNGFATASTLTANQIAGAYAVTANADQLTAVNFSLTNLPDLPAVLVAIAGEGQSTPINTPFATNLQVQVQDQYGNVVPQANIAFSAPTLGASGLFTGFSSATVVADNNGLAIAPQLTANGTGGSFQVNATLPNFGLAFNLTNQTPVVPPDPVIPPPDPVPPDPVPTDPVPTDPITPPTDPVLPSPDPGVIDPVPPDPAVSNPSRPPAPILSEAPQPAVPVPPIATEVEPDDAPPTFASPTSTDLLGNTSPLAVTDQRVGQEFHGQCLPTEEVGVPIAEMAADERDDDEDCVPVVVLELPDAVVGEEGDAVEGDRAATSPPSGADQAETNSAEKRLEKAAMMTTPVTTPALAPIDRP